MDVAASGNVAYQEVTNDTGRVFRVGETPRDILGYSALGCVRAALATAERSGRDEAPEVAVTLAHA